MFLGLGVALHYSDSARACQVDNRARPMCTRRWIDDVTGSTRDSWCRMGHLLVVRTGCGAIPITWSIPGSKNFYPREVCKRAQRIVCLSTIWGKGLGMMQEEREVVCIAWLCAMWSCLMRGKKHIVKDTDIVVGRMMRIVTSLYWSQLYSHEISDME